MTDSSDMTGKPAWIDLSSTDAAGSRDFYARLFGWTVEVNPDPQYGGYALAKLDGKDVAGIGPAMGGAPTAWMIYIGTGDAQALATEVTAAGGSVLLEPMDVGEQGRMAAFRDPAGAVISAWQPKTMAGFETGGSNTFGWAELNARGLNKAVPFYQAVFGWTPQVTEMPGGTSYTEFLLRDDSIAGAQEMAPMIPAEVPSYWMVYFNVDDVDTTFRRAVNLGAREMVSPMDFPGGRFAILGDPQGASFGILKTAT